MPTSPVCPACGSLDVSVFCQMKDMPVHCTVLLSARDEALQYPRGDIVLGFCQCCELIHNLAFDPELVAYSTEYENSLTFSPLFNTYLQDLVHNLINRYHLYGKDIIEIGCGSGDFLTMLCEAGGNRGVGFDPSYEAGRNGGGAVANLTFIQDYYSERYDAYRGDLVCCRQTLEHIQNPVQLLATVRRSIGAQQRPVLFFEVPNAMHTLRESAIWEVIYEHCSYFTPGSLSRLFKSCGFEIIDVAEAFHGQYLSIEALPMKGEPEAGLARESDFEETARGVLGFAEHYENKLQTWGEELARIERNGQRCVVWGAGARGVTFLNMLKDQDTIDYVVDVNPLKHNMYIAGTGQQIVPPEFLRDYQPQVVIVMNPIYEPEIQRAIDALGLTTEIICA